MWIHIHTIIIVLHAMHLTTRGVVVIGCGGSLKPTTLHPLLSEDELCHFQTCRSPQPSNSRRSFYLMNTASLISFTLICCGRHTVSLS